jgi:hypothetical protein
MDSKLVEVLNGKEIYTYTHSIFVYIQLKKRQMLVSVQNTETKVGHLL